MANPPLSPLQREDAARLRELFARKKRELSLTQEMVAYQLGFSGQAVVSQYLNGRIPLNIRVAIGFAKLLGVHVSEFSEALQAEIDELAGFASGAATVPPAVANEWPFTVPRGMYERLSESDKERLNLMVESFIRGFAQKDRPRKKTSRAA
jgi:DNA-binding XRE family transcriptional regulator